MMNANGFDNCYDGPVCSLKARREERERKGVIKNVTRKREVKNQTWWGKKMSEFREWYGDY